MKPVKPVERVAIIGLGLMGGSLARALASRDVYVLGADGNPDSEEAALRTGVVRERIPLSARSGIDADVIVLATPVDAVIKQLPRLLPLSPRVRLVMDVASTKRSIVEAAESSGLGTHFVGAHPLTGSHRSGWFASRAGMFDDARVFLSPAKSASAEALDLAASFWRGLRAAVEVIDAAEHDVQMAWRSHLPHMISTTLALVLNDAGIPRFALGPGGRDMTRLAGGAPSMWTPIAEDNEAALVSAIESFEARLTGLKRAIQSGTRAEIDSLLGAGSEWFDGEPG